MFSMIFGLVSAALAGFSAFSQAQQNAASQRQQAKMLEVNAEATRRNAAQERAKAESDARAIDLQKRALRREYEDLAGHNRLALGAGYVDMNSGSALDMAYGNAVNFSADMGENAYAAAMARWQGREAERVRNWQADSMSANASYLKRSAGNIGTSLLTAGLAGFGGFTQGYTLAGGKLSGLFSFKK